MTKIVRAGAAGTVIWLRDEGERFGRGDPLYILDTEKAADEVLAPCPGTLTTRSVESGTRVEARQVVGVLLLD